MKVHEFGSDGNPKTQQQVADKIDEIRKREKSNQEVIRRELKNLINYHGLDSESGTKDIILADYLLDCLRAFNYAIWKRQTLG